MNRFGLEQQDDIEALTLRLRFTPEERDWWEEALTVGEAVDVLWPEIDPLLPSSAYQ